MSTQSASRRSLDAMSAYTLIATLVLALFVATPSLAVPIAAAKSFVLAAGALIALALFILARLSRGNAIAPPVALLAALWLPALAYLLSTAFSGASADAALWGAALEPDTLGFILVAIFLGTLAALALRRPEHYRTFLVAAGWAFGAAALLQLAILAAGQFAPSRISPAFSLLGSSFDLALILGLGVVASLISFRFLDLAPRARLLLIGAIVASLVLLAVLNLPLVWTLVALVALALFVEAVMRRRAGVVEEELLIETDGVALLAESESGDGPGARALVLPLVVLAVSLFFLIGGTLSGALANALQVNVISVRPSWQSTFAVARGVYASSPVFGSGPGTFAQQWLAHRDPSLNSTVFWNVDFGSGIGFIPTSFATTGLLGAAAWLGMLALFLALGARALIARAPEDPFVRYVAVLAFAATLYLFAGAIFGLPGSVPLALALVFFGLFASTLRYAQGAGQWGVSFAHSPRIGFVIVFALTLLLLGSVVAAYALSERAVALVELSRADAALSAGDLDTADAAALRALSFAPLPAAYQTEAASAALRLSQIAASSTLPAADAQKAFQQSLAGGINAALTATHLAPGDYRNWLALGNLYAQAVPLKVQGSYASAKSAFDSAAKLNPTAPQIPYLLAQLDIANGDTKSAEGDLKNAIALKQDYTAAILLLSQLFVKDGNAKDALASAEAAAYFTPNDANVLFQVGVLRAASSDLPGAAAALVAAVAANPQFANARYFLAAVDAKRGDYQSALAQVQAIAALSPDNARAVKAQLAALEAGKDPFPANLLSLSAPPVGR